MQSITHATPALALALALTAAPAAAQQQQRAFEGLEEIVVTVERREQSLQDVAQTITAFTPEDLTRQNIQDIYDLQLEVPSLVATGGLPALTLRGIGQDSEALGPGVEPGFSLHINDIFVSQLAVALLGFHDLERIEVLPGPQGTLFGRNSTGGSINYHTHRPNLDDWEVEGDFEFAQYDKVRSRGIINLPIQSGELAARLAWLQEWPGKSVEATSATNNNRQRFSQNTLTGGTSLRLSLAWEPNEDFRSDLLAGWGRNNGAGGHAQAVADYPQWPAPPAHFNGSPATGGLFYSIWPTTTFNYNNASPVPESPRDVKLDMHQYQRYEVLWGQWITNAALPADLWLKVNANYQFFDYGRRADQDSSDLQIQRLDLYAKSVTWSGEATLTSDWEGPVNFVIGGNWQSVDDHTDVPIWDYQRSAGLANYFVLNAFNPLGPFLPPPAAPGTPDPELQRICGPTGFCNFVPAIEGYNDIFNIKAQTDTETYGIFANVYYDLTDQFRLTGGLRYSYTDRDFDDSRSLFDTFLEPYDLITDNLLCLGIGSVLPETGPAAALRTALLSTTTRESCFGTIAATVSGGLALAGIPPAQPLHAGNVAFVVPVKGNLDSGNFNAPYVREMDWDSVTGTLRAEYRPDDDTLYYAGVSTGERHGGFQYNDPPFESEEIIAYEIGLKYTLPEYGEGMVFNLSAFLYDYQDRLLQETANNVPNVINLPEAEILGAEIQWQWQWTQATSFSLNAGWLNAEATADFLTRDNTPGIDDPMTSAREDIGFCPDKPVGDQFGPGPACDGGGILQADGSTAQVNIKGNRLPRAPKLTASAGFEHAFFLTQGNVVFRADVSWRDKINYRWFENPLDEASSYHRTDLRLRYDPNDTWWWGELYVQNLENNEEVRTQLESSTNVRRFWLAAPRTIGARLGFQFGGK